MKNFWEEFEKRNNFKDKETLKSVYLALMRLILDQLREEGKIELPNWGEFYVVERKARKIKNVNTGYHEVIPAMDTIKFTPCDKLKSYIRLMK
nr:HU family DNA-binding protein [Nanoarchaeota archaeon]